MDAAEGREIVFVILSGLKAGENDILPAPPGSPVKFSSARGFSA